MLRHVNRIIPIQILMIVVLVGLLPLGLLNPHLFTGLNFSLAVIPLSEKITAINCVLASICSVLTLHKIDFFPGNRSYFASFPIVSAWYLIIIGLLFVLRLPYSITFFTLSFIIAFILIILETFITHRNRKVIMGYIPSGRAIAANKLPGVEWIRLDEPKLPTQPIHAIVADLHDQTLGNAWQKFLAQSTLAHIPVFNIRQVEESLTGRVRIRHMYENNLGSLIPSQSYTLIKTLFDYVIILALAPLLIPIMSLTALAIYIDNPGPVFFTQKRFGYGGRQFVIYKFRSMTVDANKHGIQLTAAQDRRVTRVGRFIRKVRLDELPQVLNVLKGDMSLIGPRPEMIETASEYEKTIPFYNYRHIVKPGLTGWAQVTQGYAVDANENQIKVEYDFYYIKNFSFSLDLLIIFKTVYIVLTGFGAR